MVKMDSAGIKEVSQDNIEAILKQMLSAKLEEINRDSPSLATTLRILHQLSELRVGAFDDELCTARQEAYERQLEQDAQIHRLEDHDADSQETCVELSAKIKSFSEELAKAKEEISLVKRTETDTQDYLVSLLAGLEVKSEEQDNRIQTFIEQCKKTEEDNRMALNTLSGYFKELRLGLTQTSNQCRLGLTQTSNQCRFDLTQTSNQCMQRLKEKSRKNKQTLNSLRGELNRELAEIKHSLQDMREVLYQAQHPHEDTLPTFIYSYEKGTGNLHRTSLVTGELSSHQVHLYTFKPGCCWSEVPGGSLLITGGMKGFNPVTEVARIDTRTFDVSPQTHMQIHRAEHAAVYHTQHLYVLGGLDGFSCSSSERFVCAENRWEALPPLPRGCRSTTGVVVESSLYTLGGWFEESPLNLVQKLSLERLTWELMQFRLPFAGCSIPCFKVRDTEVYLVVKKTLYSFTALEVRALRSLPRDMKSWYGASYYNRDTVYCSNQCGQVHCLEIGSLSN
jgi:hypothetical protein